MKNRTPMSGELRFHVSSRCPRKPFTNRWKDYRMEHRTGKGRKEVLSLPAFRKESEYNERVRTLFEREDGLIVEVMQISGALARTIIPWTGEGMNSDVEKDLE